MSERSVQERVQDSVLPAPTPQLAAVVLLAGALKAPPLVAESGCSTLDLHLTPASTVLGAWCARVGAAYASSRPAVRVVCDANSPMPVLSDEAAGVMIEREPNPFRGPAGVLRDVCESYGPDETVLVAEANRYLDCDLSRLLREHAQRGAAVTVACNPDRSPAGVYLVRRSTLDLVPRNGFCDLKEQWLARLVEARADVWVSMLVPAGGAADAVRVSDAQQVFCYSLRTRSGFLRAVQAACREYGRARGGAADASVGQHGLRVIAPGAEVAPDAVVTRSVVMPGAKVGAGAVVARSVVCRGAVVQPGAEVVDAVVPVNGFPMRVGKRS